LTRKPAHVALLVVIILWCGLLTTGAVLWGFMGMLFASEPAGGGMGGREFLMVSAPLLQAAALSTILIMLWKRQYYAFAAAVSVLSMAFVVYRYHGYFF
jgi:hypothetical protein